MNIKFLLFVILFFCQNILIYTEDDCSVFSCSKLDADETNQKCIFSSTCTSYYSSCEGLETGKCDDTHSKPNELTKKCLWNIESTPAKCEEKERVCSDYTSTPPPSGLACESLPAGENHCITLHNGLCKEESGCPTTDVKTECEKHKPLHLTTFYWENLKICTLIEGQCGSRLKLCDEIEEGDKCEDLSSGHNKKKCVTTTEGCEPKFINCEDYAGEDIDETKNEEECEEISDYIQDKDTHKCIWKNNACSKVKKECSEFTEATCEKHTPENELKRCVYKEIGGIQKCYELYKKCSDYTDEETNPENFCKAIEEDSYHYCDYDSSKNPKCQKKQNTCEGQSISICGTIELNDTFKCEYDDDEGKCIEVRHYKDCNLYTGNDATVCKNIIPQESNKKCILKNDSQCVSVTKECEEYVGINEYECVNNYKPLDEQKICIFKDNDCISSFKYCSDYLGSDPNICSKIVPYNNGENYSIKCQMNDGICERVDIPCSDGGEDPKVCSSIIPKDSNKKCILKESICTEDYKTCKAYNDDTNVKTIEESKCTDIISNDGKTCVYTAGASTGTEQEKRGTCKSNSNRKCDNEFDIETFENACVSIKLSDISKQCVYNKLNGECTIESKTCSELSFNGNENGIEEICKSAKASENKKCIISSDKTHCIEVDSSLVIDDSGDNGGNSNNDNNQENSNNNNDNNQENKPNSGKEIYLNTLLIIILCLLF